MAEHRDPAAGPGAAPPASPLELLGEPRAAVVRLLRSHGERSAAELAEDLGVTDVAVRRHLHELEDAGFVDHRTVKQDRGRPVGRYRLTERARELFPTRYAALASELIEFISDRHGPDGLEEYLRWRLEREAESYGDTVDADTLPDRLAQLAGALTEAGYQASVDGDGERWQLTQEHCAIYDIAKHHPEMCDYEAAAFRRLLGDEVELSRDETLAEGGHACVCTVTRRRTASQDQTPATAPSEDAAPDTRREARSTTR